MTVVRLLFPPAGWARLVVAAALLVLVGCAPQAPNLRDTAGDDPQRLAAAGRHAEAAEAWLARAAQDPEGGIAARLRAAEQWLAAGAIERARGLIDALDSDALDGADAWSLALLRVELALLDGDPAGAAGLLAAVPADLPAPLAERREALRIRVGDARGGASADLLGLLRERSAEVDFRPADALALLIDRPSDELRALAADGGPDPALAPWLDLAQRVRGRLLDAPALDRALFDWAVRWSLAPAEAGALLEWVEDWRARQPWPASIGVLLPGEGPLVRAGEAVREGVLGAWLELPPERRPQLDFVYLDATPEAAVGARFQLRERGHAMAIGPLSRDQVEALLGLPDDGQPWILLNRPRDPLPDAGPGSSAQLALPPEEEAELAAVHALVEMHQRAVVVRQASDFGRRVAGRFVETFELGGGQVLQQVEYVADEFDHTARLAELLEVDRSEQRIAALAAVLGEPVESVPQRRSDIDLVFLAARGGDGRQLMPQLRFLDLEDLPVYATSDILVAGDPGRDLDGIRLPIAPWQLATGEASERRRQAERLYPELAAAPTLSLLHALGRDALALSRWLDAMKRDPELYLAGEVGRLRLADGVVFERDLPWAVIRDGRPQPLAGD